MSKYNEYCHNCGTAIGEPSSFCASCGAALAEPEPAGVSGGGATTRAAAAAPPSSAQLAPERLAGQAAPRGTPPMAGVPSPEAPPAAQGPPTGPPGGSAEPSGSKRWLPFVAAGGGVIAIAALVAILLIALGGSAGKDVKSTSVTRAQALQLLAANGTTTVSRVSPGLFAAVSTGKLGALVPAGWRATAQTENATTRAEFADPKHPDSTLTIVTQKGTGVSDHRRALSARAAVKVRGFTQTAFGPVGFPGGREAWRLTYDKGNAIHETYFYSGCNGAAAMVVDVSAARSEFTRDQATLGTAVASAEPLC
jgi:hypothetical protein